jgi:octaheme c-type cytochrome (tetrathionate reductase family)
MERKKRLLSVVLLAVALLSAAPGCENKHTRAEKYAGRIHTHLDHSEFFKDRIATPQDVTRACLKCHPGAADEVMKTSHWQWLGGEVKVPGREIPVRIGKKNLLNNFCISIAGNWATCTKCHVGYGWHDAKFDFSKRENVDCLVCHERSGAYVKGLAGIPGTGADLAAVAQTVGYPKRENCAVCHNYGGGGQGVKHGDLDSSLENPAPGDDAHMGGWNFLCIDCHGAKKHNIKGRAFSVSVEDANGIGCVGCHGAPPHRDSRINLHLGSVACQTCHIPTYARKFPTVTFWDWSKAGDMDRPEEDHKYKRTKGEFVYQTNVIPEYAWFNMSMGRYLLGDGIDPSEVTDMNRPIGNVADKNSRIWPFKVQRSIQHYDKEFKHLLTPVTAGPGGYWSEFNWDKALRLGAAATGLEYSGEYGFTRTRMFWPLSHMVVSKGESLMCQDCHGKKGRLDWRGLGYNGDPMRFGGRR